MPSDVTRGTPKRSRRDPSRRSDRSAVRNEAPHADSTDEIQYLPDKAIIYVGLDKPVGEFIGLKFSPVKSKDDPIFIKNIVRGSIADQNKKLQVGDQVIQVMFDSPELTVEGEKLLGPNYNEVFQLMKNIHGKLHVTVCRPSERKKPDDLIMPEVWKADPGRQSRASTVFSEESSYVPVRVVRQRHLPDLPDDTRAFIKDARQMELEAPRSNLQVIPRHESYDDVIDDSKTHMFSPMLTDEELLHLPLVVPGAATNQYGGRLLHAKVAQLKDGIVSGAYSNQFQELNVHNVFETLHAGTMRHNVNRNRYPDILPYDSTRVRLKHETHDYVNASHVRLSLTNEMTGDKLWYIAAQSPMLHTLAIFWSMVWQQRVSALVLMNNLLENNQVKCVPYWPSEVGASASYGQFEVTLHYSQTLDHFTVNKLSLHSHHTGGTRKVTQYIFTAWPDTELTSIPVSPEPLIRLANYIAMTHQTGGGGGPLLVHCSDAVGRTGLFIAVNFVIHCIQSGLPFEVQSVVKQLREWRPLMVLTEEQYLFLSEACLFMLKSI